MEIESLAKIVGNFGIAGFVIYLIIERLIPMIMKKNGNGNGVSKYDIEQTQILKNLCENQIETNKKMESSLIKLTEAVTQLIINSSTNHATQKECLESITRGIARIENKL